MVYDIATSGLGAHLRLLAVIDFGATSIAYLVHFQLSLSDKPIPSKFTTIMVKRFYFFQNTGQHYFRVWLLWAISGVSVRGLTLQNLGNTDPPVQEQ